MPRLIIPAVLGIAIALVAATVGAEEEEAVTVYRKVSGCVVALYNMEGAGTGIVLDKSGLILTNAHVVSSPLPYKCRVDVVKSGKPVQVEFQRVRVVGFHPKFDLALVRIDPREHAGTLTTAKMAKEKAVPGQRVYAIGNPGGDIREVDLNKTITAGIVSGVDRVIDGVPYYQIDAPINPGNSGGPLCDRGGDVIGLVTLKFTGVENIGFAIALNDFDGKAFVAPEERPADWDKTKALVDMAEEFFNKAVEAERQFGPDDGRVEMYRYFAARYYHEAIAYSPNDYRIYYNVGMLLRSIKEYDVAQAYLVRAIELQPWESPEYYNELGMALTMQSKNDEARAVWIEGTRKFPYEGFRNWDSLAVYYGGAGADFFEAARCAAAALATRHPEVRGNELRGQIQVMRQLLDAEANRRLDDAIGKLPAELERMKAQSEQAKKELKWRLTPEFADFLRMHGSRFDAPDPSTGTSGSASNGGDKPAGDDLADASKPDVAPTPDDDKPPVDPRAKLDLSVPEGSFNLLESINARRDAQRGTWTFNKKALESPLSSGALLEVPFDLPAEYDLVLIVERLSNRKELVVGFVRGGIQSAFLFDADTGKASGIDLADSHAYQGALFTNGQPATVVMKVRREGLLVTVDGERVFFHRTDAPFDFAAEPWKPERDDRLFLGAELTRYRIHKLMLTPYERKAK